MSHPFRLSTPLCAVALAAALSAAPAFAVPTVAFSGATEVASGGSIQLGVSASGFTDLYAYQFDISFDPALFSATAVAQGGFLSTAGSTFFDGGLIDNGAGTISFVVESLIGPGAGASGAGDLAWLSFDAIGARFSSGSFAITNFLALDSALNPITTVVQDTSVTIPEPSSLALAMLALGAGVVGTSRRVRRPGVGAAAGA